MSLKSNEYVPPNTNQAETGEVPHAVDSYVGENYDTNPDILSNVTDFSPEAATRRKKISLMLGGVTAGLLIAAGVTFAATSETNATDNYYAPDHTTEQYDPTLGEDTVDTGVDAPLDYRALLDEMGPAPTYEERLEKAQSPFDTSKINSQHDLIPAYTEALNLWMNEGVKTAEGEPDMRTYYEFELFLADFTDFPDDEYLLNAAIENFAQQRAADNAGAYIQGVFLYEGDGMNRPSSTTFTNMTQMNQETITAWLHSMKAGGEPYEAKLVHVDEGYSLEANPPGGMVSYIPVTLERETNGAELGLSEYESLNGVRTSTTFKCYDSESDTYHNNLNSPHDIVFVSTAMWNPNPQ